MNETFLKELNLSLADWKEIIQRIGREPQVLETGLFSAMWSEHCSYRSSKKYLRQLPVSSEKVVQGPGENAGVIKLKDDFCLVFKVESHNHPSAVEPFQGAATGVGGIIRDIFTMGARPIALLDSLSFADPSDARSRYLLHGVVDGISFYGNCVGVPNFGGETNFDGAYQENPLVNVMCAGLLELNQLRSSAAKTTGAPVIYIGAKTGRDGIHGASFASGVLDEEAKQRKSSVQVGDPFLEKLLIEATLEIIHNDLIEAIQDMGAAGLTSSSVEMAGKGGKGIELHLEHVPLREPDISPFEMMLSESQERMMLIAKPEKTHEIQAILSKWQLDYAEIGHITDTGRIVIYHKDELLCDLVIDHLLEAPSREVEPKKDPSRIPPLQFPDLPEGDDWTSWILNYCMQTRQGYKDWIFEQYDTTLLGNTVRGPGYGATTAYAKEAEVYLGFTLNSNGKSCAQDPYHGVMSVLSVASRRLSSLGLTPIAITNCLNFGNPNSAHTMWEFSQCIEGMKTWLNYFQIPVVSGNVSFYNESESTRIHPTPVIGMIAMEENVKSLSPLFEKEGSVLAILGHQAPDTRTSSSDLPDLNKEKDCQEKLRKLIGKNLLSFAKSIDDGGLMRALLSTASRSACGCQIDKQAMLPSPEQFFFSEAHGRFLIAYPAEHKNAIISALEGFPLHTIGSITKKDSLDIGLACISNQTLRQKMTHAFSKWMEATPGQGEGL